MLGFAAIESPGDKKTSVQSIKNLKSPTMNRVLHKTRNSRSEARMTRIALFIAVSIAGCSAAYAQYGGGGMGGQRGGQQGIPQGQQEIPMTPGAEKPDVAAKKAYNAAIKSLNKARGYDEDAAKTADAEKKATALAKANDNYNKALDQFTEMLSNKGDSVEAWNYVGYIHLRLGAYREAIDDYNHTLALNPELLEAIEHRGVAYLGVDRLEDAKAAYMDLFNHARALADQLMVAMQAWLNEHQAAANGMRPADIDSFAKWIQERDGIAKQTASTG
jgi:Tetratricopeptide repeat